MGAMKIQASYITWLADQLEGHLVYVTLTYKQRRIRDGSNFSLDHYVMRSQTRWLLIRLNRELLGKAGKQGARLERLVFHEGGRGKHRHTHIIIRAPANTTRAEVERAV